MKYKIMGDLSRIFFSVRISMKVISVERKTSEKKTINNQYFMYLCVYI